MSESIADDYFRKCQYLLNENSKLKKEIIALKFENADLKQENKKLEEQMISCPYKKPKRDYTSMGVYND